MAVTKTYSNVTIRGVTYSKGSSFKCYAAVKGNGGSEGNASSASAPTVGTTYYFYCKASGSAVSYPYAISATSGGSVKGWYTEAIFPYATYSVKYNANGGSGAPGTQTKTYGTNLTLSSTKPTRTGYTFKGWGTSASDTSVDYAAGATYSKNAAITLYAIWQANTYTISFNANGGSGAPSSVTKTYGVNLKLPTTKPTRTNYEFLGWSASSSATTATYAAGGTYTGNANATLYAVWKLKYTLPTITNLKAVRCGEDGTADDFGTYAKVTFNWSCCQLTGTNNVSSITVNGTAVSASGTSGSVSVVVGGSLSIESTHTITVTVIDTLKSSGSGTTTKTTTLAAAVFAIDFKSGGKGVAIGKPATEESLFDVAFKANFDKGIVGTGKSCYWYNGRDNALLATTNTPAESSYYPLASVKSYTGAWTTGTYYDKYYISYVSDTNYSSDTNSPVHGMIIEPDGTVNFPRTVYINDNDSDGDSYLYTKSGSYTLAFGIGSGKVNRGIYDSTRSQWMINNDASNTYIRSIGTIQLLADTDASPATKAVVFGNAGSGHPLVYPNTTGYGYVGGVNYRWYNIYTNYVNTVNAVTVSSDARLKEEISDDFSKLEKVFPLLRPVTYKMKNANDGKIRMGFVAQDVKEAFETCEIDPDTMAFLTKDEVDKDDVFEDGVSYGLGYTELIALNTHIIQKQQATIEQQQEEIDELKAQLAEVRALLGLS